MTKAFLAAAVVLVVSPAAWAGTVLLPNGGFESALATTPTTGSQAQIISNWTLTLTGTPAGTGQLNFTHDAGLFGSFGKFAFPPGGAQFVGISNVGTTMISLQSGSGATPTFVVTDRLLGFQYVYLTNDPPSAGTHDEFHVHVDFFSNAAGTTQIGSLDRTIAAQALLNDTTAGGAPYGGYSGAAATTYNNGSAGNTNFNFVAVDISQFFGSFARVSFIVNNLGPVAGTNSNGLGVSGILLDNVILTPEPASMALFALGAAGLGGLALRRRSSKKPVATA